VEALQATCIAAQCGQLDPLLDDTVAFARRARDNGAQVRQVELLNALPHGFLNFTSVSPECRAASKKVLMMIKHAFDTI
jgi:acetyl esterase/lipase